MTDMIKIGNSDTVYEVEISVSYANTKTLKFTNNDMPDEDTLKLGFNVLANNGKICGVYTDFNFVYKSGTNEITLTNIADYIYTKPVIDNTDESSGSVEIPVVTETLESVVQNKISELSKACNNVIELGVDVVIDKETEHFDLTTDDQINIKALFDIATATGLSVPYHAKDKLCKEYTVQQITDIYVAEQTNLVQNTTYFNMMKVYLESLTDESMVDTVKAITYGTQLPDKYLAQYTEILENASVVINTVKTSAASANTTETTTK